MSNVNIIPAAPKDEHELSVTTTAKCACGWKFSHRHRPRVLDHAQEHLLQAAESEDHQ